MRAVLGRLGLALLGLAAGALCLVAAEGLLAALGAGGGPPGYDPFAGFSAAVPLFEPARGAETGEALLRVSPARLAAGAPGALAAQGRSFRARKPAGGFRVFVVGGSAAAGFPHGAELSFSGWLERRLTAALPGLPIEVVNAAVAGYSSRRVLVAAREIAGYEPDLVVVYSGHNEWAERRYYSRLIEMDPRLFRLRERLIGTRLFRVLSHGLPARPRVSPEAALERYLAEEQEEFREMFGVFSERAGGSRYATAEELAQRDALYRINLEEIVRSARGAGAKVALLTLSQNLSDWWPGASAHRPDLSAEERGRWQALVDRGREAAAAGDCAAALARFAEALAIDAGHAELHFRVARCQHARGELVGARAHYRRASDLDQVPHGAPTRFNDLLRELAAERDLLLVDVEALLERASGDRLVGDDLFIEFAHLNPRAHQLVAAALAAALREAGIPRPAPLWREGGYQDPPVEALYAADPEMRVREHESIRFVCAVARRLDCVREQEEALRRLREPPPAGGEPGAPRQSRLTPERRAATGARRRPARRRRAPAARGHPDPATSRRTRRNPRPRTRAGSSRATRPGSRSAAAGSGR